MTSAEPGHPGPPGHVSLHGPATPDDDLTLPPEGRITLLLTSPRSAPGLLNWAAWQRLTTADVVLAADLDPAWADEFAAAGITLQDVAASPPAERAGQLVDRAAAGTEAVWWGSPDGDPGLTDALAEHLSRRAVSGSPPQIEVLTGSHDIQGARLIDLVATMDILRSAGGCPWDGQQTHTSLLPYLLEETHEVIEAIENLETGSRDHLAEELGDLLFQVVFHARIGQEDPGSPFDIDDVAAGLVEKLVRRHPHVFGSEGAADPAGEDADGAVLAVSDVEQNWETLKAAEKPARAGFDGIPATLPALARAQKMLSRLDRAGIDLGAAVTAATAGDELAASLLGDVLRAREASQDAEATLRAALARLPTPS